MPARRSRCPPTAGSSSSLRLRTSSDRRSWTPSSANSTVATVRSSRNSLNEAAALPLARGSAPHPRSPDRAIRLNDVSLDAPDEELAGLVLRVATGEASKAEVAMFLARHTVARKDDEVQRADGSPSLELRVAVNEVVREIPDEKKRRRRERGHLAVSVKLHRLAPDCHPARDEQAGGERIQARVDSGHEAQVEPGPSGSAANDQDVEQEGDGAQRDYRVEDEEGPV